MLGLGGEGCREKGCFGDEAGEEEGCQGPPEGRGAWAEKEDSHKEEALGQGQESQEGFRAKGLGGLGRGGGGLGDWFGLDGIWDGDGAGLDGSVSGRWGGVEEDKRDGGDGCSGFLSRGDEVVGKGKGALPLAFNPTKYVEIFEGRDVLELGRLDRGEVPVSLDVQVQADRFFGPANFA